MHLSDDIECQRDSLGEVSAHMSSHLSIFALHTQHPHTCVTALYWKTTGCPHPYRRIRIFIFIGSHSPRPRSRGPLTSSMDHYVHSHYIVPQLSLPITRLPQLLVP